MDISNIPKSFWYALSFCMVAATLGILFIAYKSSSVSIEIANAKIKLSSAIEKTKEVRNRLQIENEKLQQTNADLQEILKITKLSNLDKGIELPITIEEIKKLETTKVGIPDEWFKNMDVKIQSAEKATSGLQQE